MPLRPVIRRRPRAAVPASSRISTSFNADSGVSLAGLMITALPAAIAGPTLWQTRLSGKLNGVMAATMPQGTRSVKPESVRPPGGRVERHAFPPTRGGPLPRRLRSSPRRGWLRTPSARIFPSSRLMVRARDPSRADSLPRPRDAAAASDRTPTRPHLRVPSTSVFRAPIDVVGRRAGTVSITEPS